MAYSSEPATRGFIPPRDDHERLVMRRAEELARAAESSGRVRWTSFLSDREQDLCVAAMNRAGCACYGFEGGFEQAERKLLCIRPAGAYGEPPLCCVRVEFGQPGPGHRYLLGSILGLGIKRETVGDIFVDRGSCDFLVTREILPYVLDNLTSAGRTRLSLREIPLEEVSGPHYSVKELRDTVASLRLDALVGAGFGLARGKAADLIAAGKVSLDGLPCTKPDKPVPEGGKISARGYGKVVLKEISGRTKKDRISIVLEKYV